MEQPSPSLRERAWSLLCALDDHDLRDRDRLVAKRLVRLSYGEGLAAVYVDCQQDLATFDGIGKGHIKDSLAELVRAKILQVHPDKPLYEILPDVANWQVRPRCHRGLEHARQLAAAILRQHHHRVGQEDFARLEPSFERPPTLAEGIGEVSREQAFIAVSSSSPAAASSAAAHPSRAPGPGAAGARSQHPHPPGNIRPTEAAGSPLSLSEQVRRSLAGSTWQVPDSGTLPASSPAQTPSEVPEMGTFGRAGPPEPPPKFPNRELPRARASDDHLPNHLPSHSQQLSSQSSADDQGDEGKGDERGAAEWGGRMARIDDELFADLCRTMGDDLGSFSVDWRRAIFLARACVAESLAAVKNNRERIRKHAGGYLRRCFLNECARAGVTLPPDLFGRAAVERSVDR